MHPARPKSALPHSNNHYRGGPLELKAKKLASERHSEHDSSREQHNETQDECKEEPAKLASNKVSISAHLRLSLEKQFEEEAAKTKGRNPVALDLPDDL